MNNLSDDICNSPSSNSVTVDYWKLRGDDQIIHGKVLAVFFLFYELLGLPWNILVVITIIREKLYHQPTIIFLLNLVVADLFLLVCPLPLLMTTGFAGEYIIGSSDRMRCGTCRQGFALITPFYSSFFTVALMSLDRFLYIYKPFLYERAETKYIAWVAVIVTVLVCIGLGLGFHFYPDRVVFNPSFLVCSTLLSLQTSWFPVFLVAIGIIVLAIIIICNVCFSYIVLKNIRAVYSSVDFTDKQSWWFRLKKCIESPRYQKQKRLYRMFCALLFSSLITWIPLLVLSTNFLISPSLSLGVTGVALILVFSQVVLHPILETVIIVDVRKPLIDMVTCGLFKRKQNELAPKEDRCDSCTPCISEDGHWCFLVTLIEAAVVAHNESTSRSSEN